MKIVFIFDEVLLYARHFTYIDPDSHNNLGILYYYLSFTY